MVEKISVVTDRVEDLPSVERYLDDWKIIQRSREREPYSYGTRWCGENDGRMQALHGPEPYQYRLAHRKPLRYLPLPQLLAYIIPAKPHPEPILSHVKAHLLHDITADLWLLVQCRKATQLQLPRGFAAKTLSRQQVSIFGSAVSKVITDPR